MKQLSHLSRGADSRGQPFVPTGGASQPPPQGVREALSREGAHELRGQWWPESEWHQERVTQGLESQVAAFPRVSRAALVSLEQRRTRLDLHWGLALAALGRALGAVGAAGRGGGTVV